MICSQSNGIEAYSIPSSREVEGPARRNLGNRQLDRQVPIPAETAPVMFLEDEDQEYNLLRLSYPERHFFISMGKGSQ